MKFKPPEIWKKTNNWYMHGKYCAKGIASSNLEYQRGDWRDIRVDEDHSSPYLRAHHYAKRLLFVHPEGIWIYDKISEEGGDNHQKEMRWIDGYADYVLDVEVGH